MFTIIKLKTKENIAIEKINLLSTLIKIKITAKDTNIKQKINKRKIVFSQANLVFIEN